MAKPISIVEVPLKPITPETFEGFGRVVSSFDEADVDIVTWPAPGKRPVERGTGRGGGVTSGPFEMEWKGDVCHAENHAVNGKYVTGWSCPPDQATEEPGPRNRTYVLTHEANYHPDGGQVFFSRNNEPFVALLALPKDDIKPEDFVAFYCPGNFGIHINAGVWHQPLFPISDRVTFDDKQGAVHACIRVDFVEEFGVYLKVPLKGAPLLFATLRVGRI